MRNIVIAALLFVCSGLFASDLQLKFDQVLKPVVRVSTDYGSGSGTVIYSEDRDEEGEFRTFVITNHHVVAPAIHVVRKWDNALGKYVHYEKNDQVKVEIFSYLKDGKMVLPQPVQADIVAYNGDEDLAILELYNYPMQVLNTTTLLPEDQSLHLFQEVYAVGASLGEDPFSTRGEIADLEELIEGKVYVMATAQIIFGNSGGAIFVRGTDENYYYVGVPSRIRVTRFGQAMTHMGYFIPPKRIRKFIKRHKLDFLLDSSKMPSECFKAREKMRNGAQNGDGQEPKDVGSSDQDTDDGIDAKEAWKTIMDIINPIHS